MGEGAGMGVDGAWFRAVNGLARATPWLHTPAAAWAQYGVVVFALLLVGAWWTARGAGAGAMAGVGCAGAATLVAVAVNQPIVAAVAEQRPYAVFPGALLLVARTADPAFPSDHATMSGAVAVGLLLAARGCRPLRRWAVAGVVAAVLMAAARVYVGAHYPSDVAAGLVLGGVVAALLWLPGRAVLVRLVRAAERGPLRALVRSGPRAADALCGEPSPRSDHDASTASPQHDVACPGVRRRDGIAPRGRRLGTAPHAGWSPPGAPGLPRNRQDDRRTMKR